MACAAHAGDAMAPHHAAHAGDDTPINRAIYLALMEHDLAMMEHGLDTMVGSRGVRLSGGQIQRAAAARMFVRNPALLVVDDLSSALEVETERTLWERLAQGTGNREQGTGNREQKMLILPNP
jgi:ABC-type multidrug transport system fused ATPase/permease subunit